MKSLSVAARHSAAWSDVSTASSGFLMWCVSLNLCNQDQSCRHYSKRPRSRAVVLVLHHIAMQDEPPARPQSARRVLFAASASLRKEPRCERPIVNTARSTCRTAAAAARKLDVKRARPPLCSNPQNGGPDTDTTGRSVCLLALPVRSSAVQRQKGRPSCRGVVGASAQCLC